MSETYFSKLPIIAYNNFQVRNIAERVAIVTTPRIAPLEFYPYELGSNIRADQLAFDYYDDPNLDWMIYLVNGIVDPYYGWHVYDLDFYKYIDQQYGSLDIAEQTIAYFRTNWPAFPQDVTTTYFDNLDGHFKKYFEPVFGYKQKIIAYRRRRDDLTMNTNKIVKFDITMTSPGSFANGELMEVYVSGAPVGRCECVSANDSVMVARHLMDQAEAGQLRSRANNFITATIDLATDLSVNIPDIEGAFWEPVSYFDIEREKNENKRFIDVLDSAFVMDTSEVIRKAFLSKEPFGVRRIG